MSDPEASYQAIERVQTGIRLEKRLLKVLKALAEYKDMTLGDLIEGIVLHALEGKSPFEEATLAHARDLKRIYALDLSASDSHRLTETTTPAGKPPGATRKRKGTP